MRGQISSLPLENVSQDTCRHGSKYGLFVDSEIYAELQKYNLNLLGT
jgi:hypothetical protein